MKISIIPVVGFNKYGTFIPKYSGNKSPNQDPYIAPQITVEIPAKKSNLKNFLFSGSLTFHNAYEVAQTIINPYPASESIIP
ncbi:hypothetical protein D3C73_1156430 [compost metagenome]